jgi:hypothetical protein
MKISGPLTANSDQFHSRWLDGDASCLGKTVSEKDLSNFVEHLELFHAHKDVFIGPGGGRRGKGGVVMDHFRIPKLHARAHIPDHIRDAGAMQNFSAEIIERMHITTIKEPWTRTNRREVEDQIINALNRQEAVSTFEAYQVWLGNVSNEDINIQTNDPEEHTETSHHRLSKNPRLVRQRIVQVAKEYGLPDLESKLAYFIATSNGWDEKDAHAQALPQDWYYIDVWQKSTVRLPNVHGLKKEPTAPLIARPPTAKGPAMYSPAFFDQNPDSVEPQDGLVGESIFPTTIWNMPAYRTCRT